MSKWFKSVQPFTDLSALFPTAGDLVNWIEQYVKLLFPQSGIEYWYDNRHTKTGYKPFSALPGTKDNSEDLHHVACYVSKGSCEGRLIYVTLALRDEQMRSLTTVKTFGKEDECHQIASAITEALDHIFFNREKPLLLDFAKRVPRTRTSWCYETSLNEKVLLTFDDTSIVVKTESGTTLYEQSFDDQGQNARFNVDSQRVDWSKVLDSFERLTWSAVDLRTAVNAESAVPA